MGIYLFNASDIIHELKADDRTSSAHDFGSNILPEMMKSGRIFAHEFIEKNKKEAKYRRDVREPGAQQLCGCPGVRAARKLGGVVVMPKGAEVR